MRKYTLPITASLLITFLAGCALIPDTPPEPTPTSPPPASGYEPRQGDEKLKRDQVFLDWHSITLQINESLPVQVSVSLAGSLSDPCHQLRVVVSPPSDQREINLDVYSVYDPSLVCIMVIKPFSVNIPLGTFSPGHYRVLVNGEPIGEFDA